MVQLALPLAKVMILQSVESEEEEVIEDEASGG